MAKIDLKNLEKEIKAVVAEIAEVEPEKITPEAKFVEDLGMDSMMALEILASLEKKYKLKIPEENLMKVTNLTNLIEITKTLLEEK
ncbi:MAG: acyl carrier protein [Candidatus Omnitrophica bacterium]|nr:acyl carrier protein [Candidatus Omnitrophota bacterium]